MKKILILAVAIVMCASLASAQSGGHIGLYSDAGYTDCNLVTAGAPGLKTVNVVHTLAPSAASSQFALVDASGMTLLASSIISPNIAVGNLFTGVGITYVQCRAMPWLLATISYFASGAEPACGTITVVADPAEASGQVLAVDCALNALFATGGKLTINGNETCPCVETVSTEDSSWSKIKAMYQ